MAVSGASAGASAAGAATYVVHAAELITMAAPAGGGGRPPGPRRGPALGEAGVVRDGAVVVRAGRIAAVGPTPEVLRDQPPGPRDLVLDATGKTVLPGLVDPHTHLVFAGTREDEFVARLEGRGYLEILAAGGGILRTVAATRQAGAAALEAAARARLDRMLAWGTTTAEVKSGYGLEWETERLQLEVVRRLDATHPVDLVPTFLGAHAVPAEYAADRAGYVRLVIEEMLPAVVRAGLAEFCDVFCEAGVFSLAESRAVLEAARRLGLGLKLHADEFEAIGGAELAAELGATSADHLVRTTPEGMRRLAAAGVVAVLLPATTLTLGAGADGSGGRHAPAREMIAAGCAVALATDCNPGTAPTETLMALVPLACRTLRLRPSEALAAATINAAHAVGRGGEVGSLEVGKLGDVIVCDAPGLDHLGYWFGPNPVAAVLKAGRLVARDGRALPPEAWEPRPA